ncbi:hypothetical protein ACQKMD_00165 [Viridibacillus sp. NPDC096237]|uniref:hypothetical protein n=1 Tax=Viridibacillus sp. NPDC096237 TaxID=3390721 RepID=UPI003D00A4D6
MSKKMYVKKYFIKLFSLISLPLFTCLYLDDRIGIIPAALCGLFLYIILGILLFSRNEKGMRN